MTAFTLTPLLSAMAQGPDAGNWPNVSAQSHVFQRGDVEILTFETEQDYDRLQELYRQSRDTQPAPGAMATLYYRSKLDGSAQPYAMRLPNGYSRDRKYPLVIQLHGTNFHEVLSGSRLTYRGMGGPQRQSTEFADGIVAQGGFATTEVFPRMPHSFGDQYPYAVLKRIAGSLPAGLLKGDAIFIHSNPENPSGYVVVWSAKLLSAPDPGLHAGWIMSLNLLPDYVQVTDGRVAAGGHFDNAWKL
jgi:hypothetical protein